MCHDVTTWQTETIDVPRREIRQKRVKKQKEVTTNKTTYKDVTAIRYRMSMVPTDKMGWIVKQVPKLEYRTVSTEVKVVAQPETRIDCCGRTVPLP